MTAIKNITPFALALMFISIGVFLFTTNTHANPTTFTQSAKTSIATTSPVFQTAGNGTTTVVYDAEGVSGTNQTNNGNSNAYAADQAIALVQFTASSTSSTLKLNVEYSDDGIDWYQDTPSNPNGYASTTFPVDLGVVPQYSWKFASSTLGGVAVSASNNRDTRALTLFTPSRFTRIVATCAAGGTNCGVWIQILPRKQAVTK